MPDAIKQGAWGGRAYLNNNEMVWLEERPPHLQEIQRADGGYDDVPARWQVVQGMMAGLIRLDVPSNGAVLRSTIS